MTQNIVTSLKQATKQLSGSSKTARLDAELLLAFALHESRSYLYSHVEQSLSKQKLENFSSLLKRRITGEPIAYILQQREFWSLEFYVNHDVLIPRPETELLPELVLEFLGDRKNLNVLELGIGSGAIALALAHERPNWKFIATDCSETALDVARHNAEQLNIKNVTFYCGNWFYALPNKQKFSVIISNPPYIAEHDSCLQQANFNFEPKLALLAGKDGLDALRIVVKEAPFWLERDGLVLLEHGFQQGKQVKNLMLENGLRNINCFKDLAGNDRVTIGVYSR